MPQLAANWNDQHKKVVLKSSLIDLEPYIGQQGASFKMQPERLSEKKESIGLGTPMR